MSEPMPMRIGPEHFSSWWKQHDPDGDCPECGGQCDPECGKHPAGCIFGGFSKTYWLIVEGCPLFHGETEKP